MQRLLYISIVLLCSFPATAQENPILGRWEVASFNNDILLEWTIISGNTCQGIYIWRSLDGIEFESIGHIPGLCGSVSEPIDYTWNDPEPIELATNYYRIELGGQGLSTVKSVYVDKLVQNGSLVYPNPAPTSATLIFKVEGNEQKDIKIFDIRGSIVHQESASNTDRVSINGDLFAPGTYIYTVESASGRNTGRFVIY